MEINEHTVAIVNFEGALKREIRRTRMELQKIETVAELHLQITASGRLHDGDINLKFKLQDSEYDTINCVVGDTLSAVIEEYMRRHGWGKVHNPKAIGYDKVPSDDTDSTTIPDDEIPF